MGLSLGVVVRSDRGQWRRAVRSLIHNGAEASGRRGDASTRGAGALSASPSAALAVDVPVDTDPPNTPPWLALLAGSALWFAVAAPGASLGDPPSGLGVVGDVGVVLLWAAAGWRRTAAAVWLALFVFQLVRLSSLMAMGEEGLLVDLLWLAGHVWVLAADWIGALRWPLLAALLASIGLAGMLASRLLNASSDHPKVSAGLGAGLVGLALIPLVPGGWVTPVLVRNVAASTALWTEGQQLLAEAAVHPAPHPAGPGAPDVHVYVVESYGALLMRDPSLAQSHQTLLEELQERVTAAGWVTASGLSAAPVSGGRSWIADAAVLLGTPVAHETSYRRVMAEVDDLPHLPAWFDAAGYRTVLCRPKDRARPGVHLENPLRFERTVFFADLAYEGPRHGWGWVPDQYTLGWLRDEVLPEEPQRPTFLFAHLVTAHVPWRVPPEIVEDWRDLGAPDPDAQAPVEDRSVWDELLFHLHRFRRGQQGLGADLRSYMQRGDPAEKYRRAIAYDLEVLTTHLEALDPARPAVVVWMGDHAPPGIAARHSFAVPVHVIATDPALLKPFLSRGFREGLLPGAATRLGHQDLYEPLVELVPAP